MSSNKNLTKAFNEKNDEFYTRYEDIADEIRYYKFYLKNQIVYCNCDDYRRSNFYKYFKDNFDELRLKKLIATNYVPRTIDILFGNTDRAKKVVYDGIEEIVVDLKGDGNCFSEECVKILRESDMIITNPPFSKFLSFFRMLIEYQKKFLILGSINAVIYKDVFPHIKDNVVRLSDQTSMKFELADGSTKSIPISWYNNMMNRCNEFLELTEIYSEEKYPLYDNFAAIEVSSTKDIPKDYIGVMGVPSRFVQKYNPEQFEIVGACTRADHNGYRTKKYTGKKNNEYNVSGVLLDSDGKKRIMFQRILIKNKKPVPGP